MQSFKQCSLTDALQKIQAGTVCLFDVRDDAAYSANHIPSAVNVNPGNLDKVAASVDKSAPVIVYCYHGNSSKAYAQHFVDNGFSEVYSLDGGFEAWRQTYTDHCTNA